MKISCTLLAAVLTVAVTLPVAGQDTHSDAMKHDMKHHDMSGMMGAPTVETTVQGLHIKVWLMTQAEHKAMMEANKGQMMMHGEKTGEMGRMETRDTSKGMGKDMKGMKHEGMGMDKATKDAMMAGTHLIVATVTDTAGEKEIAGASAKVLMISPSKKNSSADLKPMMGHFGYGLTLDEKGEYQFTLSVNAHGVSTTKQFQYTAK